MDGRRAGVPPLTGVADLHAHSTASDGCQAPSEVVRQAALAGLPIMALTDHDSVAGVAEARAAGEALGVRVIAGCEFSVQGDWGEVHLLGYFLPDDDPRLTGELTRLRDLRADRGRAMVHAIQKLGLPIDQADVDREAGGGAVGRPHVARALVARKVVRSIDEAFDRLLGRGRPAYVGKVLPEMGAICSLIREVGGVSSLAHPKERATRQSLLGFQAMGLDGVEVLHPSHSGPVRAQIDRLAQDLGLLRTGGSDSHGEASASGNHNVIGGERIPLAWVDAAEHLARSRR